LRRRSIAFLVFLAIISAGLTLHAGFSITYTVNYQVTYAPGKGASDVIAYEIQAVSNSSSPQPLVMGFRLPPYSTISYASGNATINGDAVYWSITVPPYGEVSEEIQFTNPLYSINIMNLNESLNVNSTPSYSAVVNGGNGTLIQLQIGLINDAPAPPTTSIYLVKQSGISYTYSETPSGFASLGSTGLIYWETGGNYSLSINYIVTNLGPWRSIRLEPVVIVSTLDTGLYSTYLDQAIARLNSTLNQLSNYEEYGALLNNSTKLLSELYGLSTLLNYTANAFRYSAIQVNETMIIERLLQLQAEELRGALQLEYSALSQLNSTIPGLRHSIRQVMSNVSAIIKEINELQRETVSDMIYANGVINAANATLSSAQFTLRQLSATVETQYEALLTTYDNLTTEINYLEALANESIVNATQRAAILAALSAARTSISTTLGLLLIELGGVRQNIAITNSELTTMEAELTAVSNELSSRGSQLSSTLTNISDTLSGTNASLHALYLALGYAQLALNSSVAALHAGLMNATSAVNLARPLYGNATGDAAALMRSAAEMENASIGVLRMYLNISTTMLDLRLAINNSIGAQRANASLMIARYKYELSGLNALRREAMHYLIINATAPYSLDVVITQTYIINLPAIVDEEALLSLLNSSAAVPSAPDMSRGGNGVEAIMGVAAVGAVFALMIAIAHFGRHGR